MPPPLVGARWIGALAWVVAGLGHMSVAWATPEGTEDAKQAARALGNRAADAVARGEHAAAEELLSQAYAHYPAPTIALLQARTLAHLQRLAAATKAYQRATLTKLGPDSPEAFRQAVESARVEARALLPRVPRLQVVVRGRALLDPRVRLYLDGRHLERAQLGRWMLVEPGRRVVAAELDGVASEQVVRMEEKQATVVHVSEPKSSSALGEAAFWGALGVGVAGVGTGVATGLVATSAHARALRACPEERCVAGGPGARDLERFRSFRVVSTVGYALGAAGLAVSGFLFFRKALEEPTLRLELDRRSALLQWQGAL